MKEELISFKTAKLAKEKGFDENINRYYEQKHGSTNIHMYEGSVTNNSILAPTQNLLQRWLREVHRIHIVINLWIDMDRVYHYNYTLSQEYYPGTTKKTFIPFVKYVKKTGRIADWRINHPIKENVYSWRTYEEALEAGLQEALKLIP